MTDATHHDSFSSAISLDLSWPSSEPENLSIAGHTRFAASYIEAAERALLNQDDVRHPFEFFLGPTLQLTGLATELTLKTLLRGNGRDEKQIRDIGHNAYKAYYEARSLFDEVRFINMVAYNCQTCLPDIVRLRLNEHFGDAWPEGWNVFIPQIKLLDSVYDRPFRSRYHRSGEIFLPEPFVIIIGIKTLLSAMLERIGDERLPGSLVGSGDTG